LSNEESKERRLGAEGAVAMASNAALTLAHSIPLFSLSLSLSLLGFVLFYFPRTPKPMGENTGHKKHKKHKKERGEFFKLLV
jgi:hypothetical protein